MAVFSEYASVIDGVGIATIEPGFRVPQSQLGIATIGPGFAVQQSQLGNHIVEQATLVDPCTGWPPPPMPGQGLGLISEQDAWRTGRPYGLPGTTAIQTVRQPDGSYASRMLGDVPNDFEASVDLQYIPVRQGWYYGQQVNGLGIPVNEVQRSLNDTFDLGIFSRRNAGLMLGAIGGTIVLGIIGAVVVAASAD